MHSRSDNITFTSCNNVDEFFDSLCLRYQGNSEKSMKGSDFTFNSVQLMYYKCHKVNFRRGGSCIEWWFIY